MFFPFVTETAFGTAATRPRGRPAPPAQRPVRSRPRTPPGADGAGTPGSLPAPEPAAARGGRVPCGARLPVAAGAMSPAEPLVGMGGGAGPRPAGGAPERGNCCELMSACGHRRPLRCVTARHATGAPSFPPAPAQPHGGRRHPRLAPPPAPAPLIGRGASGPANPAPMRRAPAAPANPAQASSASEARPY